MPVRGASSIRRTPAARSSSIAASTSATATPMWSMLPNTWASVPSAPVRIALAANRASGGGLDPEPLLAAMRSRGAEVAGFGCRDEDLQQAAAWRPDRLAVAGGDGTVGPVAELAGRLGVPPGVIPAGTANDFVRVNGLPPDPIEAAAPAGTGTQLRRLKPRLGPLAYGVGAARAAATASPLRCAVRVDGRTVFEGGAWQVIVAVTGAFGGGSAVGAADPEDGVLDVAVIPGGSRLGLARRAWGLKRHTIAEQPGVEHHRGAVVEVDLPPGTE